MRTVTAGDREQPGFTAPLRVGLTDEVCLKKNAARCKNIKQKGRSSSCSFVYIPFDEVSMLSLAEEFLLLSTA